MCRWDDQFFSIHTGDLQEGQEPGRLKPSSSLDGPKILPPKSPFGLSRQSTAVSACQSPGDFDKCTLAQTPPPESYIPFVGGGTQRLVLGSEHPRGFRYPAGIGDPWSTLLSVEIPF